ncbi:hypothetical protein CAPTEDRAFT_108336 [Capitella teleta]|uniref:Zinc/iron permease n=1 Tax=Capitella teleta TaxID=283909 RepID=R7TAG6_CAPTE|nr:hypothetical protein CAPTEDRAFT_108336 [Capitella teleta]|eukprot:ELT88472.1 hypothetical protein CAPTEDRAFT_108336 [Capitella teleta]
MERWEAKLISLFGMFAVIFVSMALPIKASDVINRRGESAGKILALMRCFAGGVFLGTILLHMVPEVHDQIQESLLEPKDIDYPISELLIALGFFFICVFERFVLLVHKRKSKNGNQADNSFEKDDNCNQNNSRENGAAQPISIVSFQDKPADIPGHGADAPDDSIAKTRSLVLVLALSFECIFDGLSVGLQMTETGVWNMFIAIISHEFIIAFCLGIELTKFHSKTKVLLASFVYAMIPPIGCAVGMIITETDLEIDEDTLETTSGLLIAVSAGIFLYCTFIGMLGEELIEHCTFEKIAVTFVGCAIMAGLAALPEDDEEVVDLTTVSMLTTSASLF